MEDRAIVLEGPDMILTVCAAVAAGAKTADTTLQRGATDKDSTREDAGTAGVGTDDSFYCLDHLGDFRSPPYAHCGRFRLTEWNCRREPGTGRTTLRKPI